MWLLLGSLMLVDPNPKQQRAGLQHAIFQLHHEVTRPKARFKLTWPKKSELNGGSVRCQHILNANSLRCRSISKWQSAWWLKICWAFTNWCNLKPVYRKYLDVKYSQTSKRCSLRKMPPSALANILPRLLQSQNKIISFILSHLKRNYLSHFIQQTFLCCAALGYNLRLSLKWG